MKKDTERNENRRNAGGNTDVNSKGTGNNRKEPESARVKNKERDIRDFFQGGNLR